LLPRARLTSTAASSIDSTGVAWKVSNVCRRVYAPDRGSVKR
jgi:hypothetical protein